MDESIFHVDSRSCRSCRIYISCIFHESIFHESIFHVYFLFHVLNRVLASMKRNRMEIGKLTWLHCKVFWHLIIHKFKPFFLSHITTMWVLKNWFKALIQNAFSLSAGIWNTLFSKIESAWEVLGSTGTYFDESLNPLHSLIKCIEQASHQLNSQTEFAYIPKASFFLDRKRHS